MNRKKVNPTDEKFYHFLQDEFMARLYEEKANILLLLGKDQSAN